MRKIVVSVVAGAMLATGVAATVSAADGVTASYGCNSATFTNHTKGTVGINYGSASSDDAKHLQLRPGASRTVNTANRHFGWTATNAAGTDIGHLWWPGVDLTARCKSGSASKEPTSSTTRRTESRGGLAKTGVDR